MTVADTRNLCSDLRLPAYGARWRQSYHGRVSSLPQVDPVEVRSTLTAVERRLSALIRSIENPAAHAVGNWNAGDVAVHLVHVWENLTALADAQMDSPLQDIQGLDSLTLEACYEITVRGAGHVFLVVSDGAITVLPHADRRVDCHISADPATLPLLLFGRTAQWRAILTGRMLAWGRRPWVGPRLRTMIRNP